MDKITEALRLLEQAQTLLRSAIAGDTGDSPDVVDLSRVATVGKVAHLHLAAIEAKGTITVDDSKEIRRELYPDPEKMRSTANFFGRENSRAILWRVVEYGTRMRGDQEIRLTAEGLRLAELYRQTMLDGANA
jgi:hypothetical protein